jgi:hypothetical protein
LKLRETGLDLLAHLEDLLKVVGHALVTRAGKEAGRFGSGWSNPEIEYFRNVPDADEPPQAAGHTIIR